MTITISAQNRVTIQVTGKDTLDWANRPGASWPCSTMSRHGWIIELDANGDLLDLAGLKDNDWALAEDPENVAGDEVTAFIDDVLTNTAARLLAMRRAPVA